MTAPEGTLYDGEEYVLLFKFNSKYPFDSPQVSLKQVKIAYLPFPSLPLPPSLSLSLPIFLLSIKVTFTGGSSPCHPHIYSNGHICLSILDKDWSPAMSVVSVCLSIQSMLSTCTVKVRERGREGGDREGGRGKVCMFDCMVAMAVFNGYEMCYISLNR